MFKVFDGKKFAEDKYEILRDRVTKLQSKGVTPRLTSIIIGENPVGLFYAKLKKKTAAKIGISVDIVEESGDRTPGEIKKLIQRLNGDKNVHGIMLQLPLPDNFSQKEIRQILDALAPQKDVDGLSENSGYLMPTVKAVLMIMREAEEFTPLKTDPYTVLVVGFTGFEGGGVYKALKEMGYGVAGANSLTKDLKKLTTDADVLISATGVPGLVTEDMVKEGVVIIDVGSPKGDFDNKAYEKSSFVSPVPGGVGPVTVSCLLENLVDATKPEK